MTETELQQACDRFVHNEVKCCLSYLVSTLANNAGTIQSADEAQLDLMTLCEQASELSAPIDDYEEAAIQAGATFYEADGAGKGFWRWRGPHEDECSDSPSLQVAAEKFCHAAEIDPESREVFEHWAVSTYLADALEAQGEKVDRDFAGLIVWARTTTGQAIGMDHCIRTIVEKMHAAPVEG